MKKSVVFIACSAVYTRSNSNEPFILIEQKPITYHCFEMNADELFIVDISALLGHNLIQDISLGPYDSNEQSCQIRFFLRWLFFDASRDYSS